MNKSLTQSDFDIPLSIFAKPTGNSDFDVTNKVKQVRLHALQFCNRNKDLGLTN